MVTFRQTDEGVQMVLTIDAMHDEPWTESGHGLGERVRDARPGPRRLSATATAIVHDLVVVDKDHDALDVPVLLA